MLDVIAVVEEQKVIEASMVVYRMPAPMLEMALQGTERETEKVAGDVGTEEEIWCLHQ
jgi:hypothetical protein